MNPNTQTREFALRDPDGYYVTISALPAPEPKEPAKMLRNKRVNSTKARGQIRQSPKRRRRLRS